MWAGLIVSSLTKEGKDESNLIYFDILGRMHGVEVILLKHLCEKANKEDIEEDFILLVGQSYTINNLVELTGINQHHVIRGYLFHLDSLKLIVNNYYHSGSEESYAASMAPTDLGFNLYIRGMGSQLSPYEYFHRSDINSRATD